MIDMVSIVTYAIVMSEENGMEHATQWVSVIARMVFKGENVGIVWMAFTDNIVRHVDAMLLVVQVQYVTKVMENVVAIIIFWEINVVNVKMATMDQIAHLVVVILMGVFMERPAGK